MIESIKDYIHKFIIDGEDIEMKINYDHKHLYWEAHLIKGDNPMPAHYGGTYESLEDYIKEMEKEMRYGRNFHKYGYKQAKQMYNNGKVMK